jgi:hypothetical protein|tara:strand:+ start:11 stop:289 length:279 start_codon:yes stop_codon:yes gene_type:complete
MKIKIDDEKKVKALEKVIGPIEKLEGELIGEYGARLIAKMRKGPNRYFELSCGQLGAYDKDKHNDPTADFSSYKMNWEHILKYSTQTKERWR